jgi:pilus assembly protein Flp/PilA
MRRFLSGVGSLLTTNEGPTAVEYAVMLALIIVVCISAVRLIGTKASEIFSYVGGQMNTVSGGGGS